MRNTFAVYFQIFATFGYKKVKNSDSFVEQKKIADKSIAIMALFIDSIKIILQ